MNLAAVQALLRDRLPGLIAIYVFGSQATGQATETSDIDIAVLAGGVVDPQLLWELAGALADILHLPVDLLDLRSASSVMQYQVITTGRCLWSSGGEAQIYEAFILSEKTGLDAARAGLLSDIAHTGRIHDR
ncbi:type VII toxin-antitoxin system MntA family adenylyltransferase antitoxin [Pseudomonas sp. Marseille-Q5115]|uniref:type VII toxin-antitoxin system MntA family adenylyltransferase antitoxin n=1 Tax=Pseudomonas sp. Marseille-Q5115 TaxID=2866593 RepID=UPI001CE47CD8|nr:nucleotidyltransferase domain-containing protein [Pseudomonas sp. Marseille-Q5115]